MITAHLTDNKNKSLNIFRYILLACPLSILWLYYKVNACDTIGKEDREFSILFILRLLNSVFSGKDNAALNDRFIIIIN